MLRSIDSPLAVRPPGGEPYAGELGDDYNDALGRGRAEDDVSGWATCSRDVYAGLPFAGALYREDGDERAWIEAFPPDEPGRIGDVRAYGPGSYVLELLTDGTRRGAEARIDISAATRRPAQRGGSAAAPTVGADDLRAIEERARRDAETEAERSFDRQKRRLEEERDDALDDARRARGRAEAADARVQLAQEAAAALREQLQITSAALSEERMQRAAAVAEEGRKHLNELERLRREAREAELDAKMLQFRLDRVTAGEDDPGAGGAMKWIERFMDSDAATALLGGLAARFGGAGGTPPTQDDAPGYEAYAEPNPYTEPTALPAPPVFLDDTALAVSGGYGGDGYAAAALAPTLAAPAADPAPLSPYDAVVGAAAAALEGAASALTPERFGALVAEVHAGGVLGADDWRSIGRDVLTVAVQRAADADLVARYLAPVLRPFAPLLQGVLAIPARQALAIAAPQLGIDTATLERPTKDYLISVLKALKPLL